MAAKKRTKTANICANIYEGEFQVSFDCVGVAACRFALCHMMPPDGSEECTYREHGACLSPSAKHAALEALHGKIRKELKQYAEDAAA
jgi:hypothetical protein